METKIHQSPWKQKTEAVLCLLESLGMPQTFPGPLQSMQAPASTGKQSGTFPSLVTDTSAHA